MFGQVAIPRAVLGEIFQRGPSLAQALPAWIQVHDVKDRAQVDELRLILDPGESEALVLASELGALLVIDERAGRREARSRGLPHTGTVGLLLDAKRAGLVPALKPLLDQLHSVGFRMSASLLAGALQVAGEAE
jgi:predicted nucleic acid-binding protein